jgi:hypothetical protein
MTIDIIKSEAKTKGGNLPCGNMDPLHQGLKRGHFPPRGWRGGSRKGYCPGVLKRKKSRNVAHVIVSPMEPNTVNTQNIYTPASPKQTLTLTPLLPLHPFSGRGRSPAPEKSTQHICLDAYPAHRHLELRVRA